MKNTAASMIKEREKVLEEISSENTGKELK